LTGGGGLGGGGGESASGLIGGCGVIANGLRGSGVIVIEADLDKAKPGLEWGDDLKMTVCASSVSTSESDSESKSAGFA